MLNQSRTPVPWGGFLFIVLFAVATSYQIFLSKSNNTNKQQPSLQISYLTHKFDSSTIDEILTLESKGEFIKQQSNYLNLGNHSFLWLQVKVGNVELSNLSDHLLEFKRNNIETPIELFYKTAEGWQLQSMNSGTLFRLRTAANLPIQTTSNTFYLKLTGRYLRGSLHIYHQQAFLENIQTSALVDGIFYGCILFTLFYSLMLYSRLKANYYLAYSALLAVLVLFVASGQGWVKFLYPNLRELSILHTTTFGLLLGLCIAEFAKQFLQLKSIVPLFHKVLSSLQIVIISLLFLKALSLQYASGTLHQIGFGIGWLALGLIIISSSWAAILSFKKGIKEAKYYIIATGLFFTVSIIMGLSAANIIALPFTWQLFQIATIIEVFIFSAGLAALYNRNEQKNKEISLALTTAENDLLKQLELSNTLKENMLKHVINPSLLPQLAQVSQLLTSILFVKASGNDCTVFTKHNGQIKKLAIECNLQNLLDCFGENFLIRVHKSYLINPTVVFTIQRRTSADYDLNIQGELIPIGRKYLAEIKQRQNPLT